MINGLIFGGVVVIWAVVLVPWALRRYDEATRDRPIETFSAGLRILSRRPRRHHGETTVPDEPTDERPIASARTLAAQADTVPVESNRPRSSRRAAREAARRRRRVLLGLLTVTALVGALAASPLLPWWSVLVPAGVVLVWLVTCRIQVRAQDAASWERARAELESRPAASPGRADTARSASARTVRTPAEVAASLVEEPADAADEDARRRTWSQYGIGGTPVGRADDEPTVVLTAEGARPVAEATGPHALDPDAAPVREDDLRESTTVAVQVAVEGGSSLWDPLPVTLPTYVSKPRASRSIRTIELGAPGAWTSGHVAGEQTELPLDEADESQPTRRAVGD